MSRRPRAIAAGRDRLVAAHEADEAVEQVAARDELDRVRDDLAADQRGLHALGAHRHAVADGDRPELHRRPARRPDALLDELRQPPLVEVAGHRLDPGRRDADDRLGQVLVREAHGLEHRPGRRRGPARRSARGCAACRGRWGGSRGAGGRRPWGPRDVAAAGLCRQGYGPRRPLVVPHPGPYPPPTRPDGPRGSEEAHADGREDDACSSRVPLFARLDARALAHARDARGRGGRGRGHRADDRGPVRARVLHHRRRGRST